MLFFPIFVSYDNQLINVVSPEQFENIPDLLNIKKPLLKCSKNSELSSMFSFGFILKHYDCKSVISIVLRENLNKSNKLNEKEFKAFFSKIFPSNGCFLNPNDFDKHFSDYFDYYKTFNNLKEFIFYDNEDEERQNLIFDFCSKKEFIGSLYIFYGLPGMGKSTTIIKAFKYDYDHTQNGTLYINCKCIYYNFMNNLAVMKNILIDEIPYLFQNEYNNYLKCRDEIWNYCRKPFSTFWEVINIIEKYCDNTSKNYFFIFDQYKHDIDLNQELFKFNLKVKNKKNFGLIACCSMNDKDVRNYKLSTLFGEEIQKKTENMIIIEIKEVVDISPLLEIDKNGKYDKALEKLGKTFKSLNELKDIYYFYNYDQLNKYMEEKRKKIKENLLEFFKIKGLNGQIELDNIYNILYFSVGKDYQLDYLKKIKNYIPFKYFNIKKCENNDELAYIEYNFPLVQEVLGEIYEYIIYGNSSIYNIFNEVKLDAGALGGIFEKLVSYHMSPNNIIKKKLLFQTFCVTKVYTVDKFLPNDNEKINEKMFECQTLEQGTYFFKQKIFSGKGFDLGIIEINNKNQAKVYLFQVSISKEKIYTAELLKKYINGFIEYFKLQFSFVIEKENVFFTYLFDPKNKDNLLQLCDNKNMPCIFFNPLSKLFTDKNDYEIINIQNIFIAPFKKDNDDIIIEDLGEKMYNKTLDLNEKNTSIIIEILKKEMDLKDNIKLQFSHKISSFSEEILDTERIFIRKIENDEKGWKSCFSKYKTNDLEKKVGEKEEEKEEKLVINAILLIFKKDNLIFKFISKNGKIYGLNKIPIIKKTVKRYYDIYNILKK